VKISILNDVSLQKKDGPEARVAATPDTVGTYVKSGHEVSVVKGAGAKADFADSLYKDTSRGYGERRGHYRRFIAHR